MLAPPTTAEALTKQYLEVLHDIRTVYDQIISQDESLLHVIGRLRSGIAAEVAQHELTTVMRELARRHPDTNTGLGVNVKSLHTQVVGDVSRLVESFPHLEVIRVDGGIRMQPK